MQSQYEAERQAAAQHPFLYWGVGGTGLLLSVGVMFYGFWTASPIAAAGCLLAIASGTFIRSLAKQ